MHRWVDIRWEGRWVELVWGDGCGDLLLSRTGATRCHMFAQCTSLFLNPYYLLPFYSLSVFLFYLCLCLSESTLTSLVVGNGLMEVVFGEVGPECVAEIEF